MMSSLASFVVRRRRAVITFWIVLLLFFDVVFVTLSLWTFEPLMTE